VIPADRDLLGTDREIDISPDCISDFSICAMLANAERMLEPILELSQEN
jgi:hypothetical protein